MLIQHQWNNSVGLQSPWLLGAVPGSSPGSLPEIAPGGQRQPSRHTPLPLLPLLRVQSVSNSNSRPRPNVPFWVGIYYHALDFSQEEEEFPCALPVPSTTRFPRSWGAHPCFLTPDLGHPRLRSGKLLRLMRPGCFRFAFAPFSLQLGRLRKKKVGGRGREACA